MPINPSTLQFAIFGESVVQTPNGFTFRVIISDPSPIAGAPAHHVGFADVEVANAAVCLGMAEAIRQIAEKLPRVVKPPEVGEFRQ